MPILYIVNVNSPDDVDAALNEGIPESIIHSVSMTGVGLSRDHTQAGHTSLHNKHGIFCLVYM